MGHHNPKSGQGDGAGFQRLRAAQNMRTDFTKLILKSHPSAEIYIDQVREYAGSQIAFYRATYHLRVHARCAVFIWSNPTATRDGQWTKVNDIILNEGDNR